MKFNEKYFLKLIKDAKIGSIIPVYKTVDNAIFAADYFAKLTDYGRKENCVLLESIGTIQKYSEHSIGSADPCLKISGKDEKFSIKALNNLGEKMLDFIKDDLKFCDDLAISEKEINGVLKPQRKNVHELDRLKLKTHVDILRIIAFKFQPKIKPFNCYGGLFGAFSYDFIDQFEDLPKNADDDLKENDYEFYYLDNLFYVDRKNNKTYFVSNAIKFDNNCAEILTECKKKLDGFESKLNQKIKFEIKKNNVEFKVKRDISRKEFISDVNKIKKHIIKGDIFQCVYSKTIESEINNEPFSIYKSLSILNPSPYMFFINFGTSILLGASPEMNLRVFGEEEKIVEIRPIAGTMPRGLINEKIDPELDLRYEIMLKTNKKEIAEHTMLLDLARNDIAKISKPNTRIVDDALFVEKYSHVQHLVSNVKGVLRKGLDCFHAYLATMNMGTLTGAPKIRAMQISRKYEKKKRGFYGGAVSYITPSKDMDSCIIIRSMTIKNNSAYIRTGAGIVHDSNPKSEYLETERKAASSLLAIKLSGDIDG